MELAVLCLPLPSLAPSVLSPGICPFLKCRLGASVLSLGICLVFLYPVGSCVRFVLDPFLIVWRRACTVVVTFPFFVRHFAHSIFAFISFPHLRYQARRCSAQGRKGCAIYVVPVTLGAWLVAALDGCGLATIGWSAGRCALYMRTWTPTWALILGAQVEIL